MACSASFLRTTSPTVSPCKMSWSFPVSSVIKKMLVCLQPDLLEVLSQLRFRWLQPVLSCHKPSRHKGRGLLNCSTQRFQWLSGFLAWLVLSGECSEKYSNTWRNSSANLWNSFTFCNFFLLYLTLASLNYKLSLNAARHPVPIWISFPGFLSWKHPTWKLAIKGLPLLILFSWETTLLDFLLTIFKNHC